MQGYPIFRILTTFRKESIINYALLCLQQNFVGTRMIAKAKCTTLVWQVMTTDYFLSLLSLESRKLPFMLSISLLLFQFANIKVYQIQVEELHQY
jgi:hypothetical protein